MQTLTLEELDFEPGSMAPQSELLTTVLHCFSNYCIQTLERDLDKREPFRW